MGELRIFREGETVPISRGSGITSQPYAGAATGSTTISNGITSFPPGAAIPMHSHNTDEAILVLEGELTFESPNRQEVLRPFDGTFVPAGVPHRFKNESPTRGRILWTYASVDVTRTFTETGQTVQHLSPGDRAH